MSEASRFRFRAWVPADHWISGGVDTMIDGWEGTTYIESTCFEPDEDSGIILMQSTGLTDSKGVEIYEGDIVDALEGHDYYCPNRQVVERHALAFMFVGKTKLASPLCKYTLSTITNKDITQVKGVEVIGNIHQNLELIERGAGE